MYKEYIGATISDIRCVPNVNGDNRSYVYAKILSADGKLLVSATLDFCYNRMKTAAIENAETTG